MKFKLEIEEGKQMVECSGHPLSLLLNLCTFFNKQEQCLHLVKYAIQLAEVAEKAINDGEELHKDNPNCKEGEEIIKEYMKRYDKDLPEES